ncbi:hypothetical protein [Enterobacter kobei]|uniref:hypothetical protein n=1 Tax=Enterobacter kobei TaxID=208224 RepID=UPI00376CEF2C
MSLLKRQDIQVVNIKAEQLAGLSQTLLNITTNWTISNLKLFALLFMTLLAKFMIGPKKKRRLL